MTTQVPVVPLLYGGAWASTRPANYTGWPTASNPYMVPGAEHPSTWSTPVLQLKPKS